MTSCLFVHNTCTSCLLSQNTSRHTSHVYLYRTHHDIHKTCLFKCRTHQHNPCLFVQNASCLFVQNTLFTCTEHVSIQPMYICTEHITQDMFNCTEHINTQDMFICTEHISTPDMFICMEHCLFVQNTSCLFV